MPISLARKAGTLLLLATLILSGYAFVRTLRLEAEQLALSRRLGELQSSLSATITQRDEDRRSMLAVARAAEAAWVASADGKVQARLVAGSDSTLRDQSVLLVFDLRNASDGVLILSGLIPFPYGLKMTLDGQPVSIAQPRKRFSPPVPIRLVSGGIYRVIFTLERTAFPVLSTAGEFKAEYRYASASGGPQGWTGDVGPLVAQWVSR